MNPIIIEVTPSDSPAGSFSVKVNGRFALPAPTVVGQTGGFTGTPADQTDVPNPMGINHDTLEEAVAIAVPRNELGGQVFDIIRSDATGTPRFQLIGRSLAFPDDWKVVWRGTPGTPVSTNPPGFNVWSQDQADNQGQDQNAATAGRPLLPTTTNEPST